MKKGIFCVLVCMLMIVSTIIPVSGTTLTEKTSQPLITGNTLYVGGSGPGNYSTIQEAVDAASQGDTVFVYDDSSPYIENIVIDKSISLIGEDKYTTIIDGNEKEGDSADVIHIQADGVTIQRFTIQNSSLNGSLQGQNNYCGIDIKSHNNIIRDNIIRDNTFGIQMGGIGEKRIYSKYNIIEGNIITDNAIYGIYFTWAYNNIIQKNIITYNKNSGVSIAWGKNQNNLLTLNTISFNGGEGVGLNGAYNNTIQQNTITDNNLGISVEYSTKNRVIENNIFNNEQNAQINSGSIGLIRFLLSNTWDGNYWGYSQSTPYLIRGKCYFTVLNIISSRFVHPIPIWFPFVKFDRDPAQEPYDIPGMT